MNKDKLDKALEKALAESYDELRGLDLPDYDFSDSFEKKMSALIKEQDKTPVKKRKLLFMIPAAAAAMILCAASVWGHIRPGNIPVPPEGSVIQETTADNFSGSTTTISSPSDTAAATSSNNSTNNTASEGSRTTAVTANGPSRTTVSSSGRGNAFRVTTTVRSGQQTAVTTSYERSYDMKKLEPLAVSMLVFASFTSENVRASVEDYAKTMATPADYTIWEEMENGTILTDINNDGTFDIKDCFDIVAYEYGYDIDESVAATIKANYDFNGDGYIYAPEPENLISYYVRNNDITLIDVDPASYRQWDQVATAAQAENFVWLDPTIPSDPNTVKVIDYDNYNRFFGASHHDIPSYQPDKFAEYEADFRNYLKGRKLSEIFTGKLKNAIGSYNAGYSAFCELVENGTVDLDINKNGMISIKDYEMIINDQLEPACLTEATRIIGWFGYNRYPLWYCLEQSELLTDQEEIQHFSDCISGKLKGSVYTEIKKTYEAINDLVDPALKYNFTTFYSEYDRYYDKLANGTEKLPDTNGDGVVDVYDLYNTIIFISGRQRGVTMEASILPDDVWKTLMYDFDLNGNGISGDVHDMTLFELCVPEFATDPEDFRKKTQDSYGRRLRDYKIKLMTEKGVDDGTLELLLRNSPQKTENVLSGDVNSDGLVNAVDASMVLSYYTKLSASMDGGFTAQQEKAADFNGDEVIDAVDASNILSYYSQLSTEAASD